MFTGIVQTKGIVAAIERVAFGVRLTIDTGNWTPTEGRPPIEGDSVCVSGVCLTAAAIERLATAVGDAGRFHGRLVFDVIAETLAVSTLGDLREGDVVNIEPSVTPQQPLGGHFMQGHVDGVGEVTHVLLDEHECRITIQPPEALMAYIIPKGSVAIDGVSLTLAKVHEDIFEVALIPTTLQITTLGQRKVGHKVNLEADILAKTIVTSLRRMRGIESREVAVTMDLLREAGFAG